MCKWYKEMDCYILISEDKSNRFQHDKIAQRAKLEQSFRNYAAVFEKVKIVIDDSLKKEFYLNFPFLCLEKNSNPSPPLSEIFSDATSDAVFIGNSKMTNFPISILANLIKSYKDEMFMGYKQQKSQSNQLQFGIYNKSLVLNNSKPLPINKLNKESVTILPLPESAEQFI